MENGFFKTFSEVKLYVIISSNLMKKSLEEVLQDVIEGGADAIQLREKTMSDHEFLIIARQVRKVTAQSKTVFIVNDRVEIARKADADGLHIGQSDIDITTARNILGHNKIIGVSTHTISQARRAQQSGADYIGAGPVFSTATKSYEPPVGLDYVQQVKKEITIPFVAVGGINIGNVQEVLHAGGRRIAICSAIICSENIIGVTRVFKDLLMA
ncbi:thiamine phosphate synthase [Candidatus Brocadia pituitae]|nr:thiamine phosphate synthase [Candidatus Brocadia pituitae]